MFYRVVKFSCLFTLFYEENLLFLMEAAGLWLVYTYVSISSISGGSTGHV